MRTKYVAGCAVALLFVLAGCSDTPAPPADTSAADQKAIKDGETQWSSDWGAKDLDKIVSHYADNATLMIPNTPALKGKDAIRTGLQGFLADSNLSMNFTTSTVATSKSGDVWLHPGHIHDDDDQFQNQKRRETEQGKYLTVYQKQADGSWKAVEDISNADAPAVAEAATAKRHVAAAPKKRKK